MYNEREKIQFSSVVLTAKVGVVTLDVVCEAEPVVPERDGVLEGADVFVVEPEPVDAEEAVNVVLEDAGVDTMGGRVVADTADAVLALDDGNVLGVSQSSKTVETTTRSDVWVTVITLVIVRNSVAHGISSELGGRSSPDRLRCRCWSWRIRSAGKQPQTTSAPQGQSASL